MCWRRGTGASARSRGAMLFQRFWEDLSGGGARSPSPSGGTRRAPSTRRAELPTPPAALKHLARRRAVDARDLRRGGRRLGDANRLPVRRLIFRRRRDRHTRRVPRRRTTRQPGRHRPEQDGRPSRIAGSADGSAARRVRRRLGAAPALHAAGPGVFGAASGQTTDRASPHRRDQIGIFAGRDLRPAWYSAADIAPWSASLGRAGWGRRPPLLHVARGVRLLGCLNRRSGLRRMRGLRRRARRAIEGSDARQVIGRNATGRTAPGRRTPPVRRRFGGRGPA